VASRWWPLAVFFNLLDIISLNTFLFDKDIGMYQRSRRDFLLRLGEELCEKERRRQSVTPRGVQFTQDSSIERVDVALAAGKRTTCRSCQKNKTREQCCNCKKYVHGTCAKHACQSCLPMQD